MARVALTRFAEELDRREWSAERVAKATACSIAAVYSWRSGERTPSPAARLAIATMLGTTRQKVDKMFPVRERRPTHAAGWRMALRLARVARGWSAERAGQVAGLSTSAVSQIETGARPYSDEVVQYLIDAVGTQRWFLEAVEANKEHERVGRELCRLVALGSQPK